MNIVQNENLQKILNAMPALPEKMKLLMIFALIDGYLSDVIDEKSFLNDIKVLLAKEDQ